MWVLVPVYYVSSRAHISRRMCDIMRSVYKLVVCNHMNLVRTHRLDPMCFVCHVCMTRRDNHVRIPRSPICMMHRNHS